jgi:hypothetical protein
MHRNNILIYIQQGATLHSLFYLQTALHVSGGTCTHHQECKQLYLQHLVFVTPLLLPAAIAVNHLNCRLKHVAGVTRIYKIFVFLLLCSCWNKYFDLAVYTEYGQC